MLKPEGPTKMETDQWLPGTGDEEQRVDYKKVHKEFGGSDDTAVS